MLLCLHECHAQEQRLCMAVLVLPCSPERLSSTDHARLGPLIIMVTTTLTSRRHSPDPARLVTGYCPALRLSPCCCCCTTPAAKSPISILMSAQKLCLHRCCSKKLLEKLQAAPAARPQHPLWPLKGCRWAWSCLRWPQPSKLPALQQSPQLVTPPAHNFKACCSGCRS